MIATFTVAFHRQRKSCNIAIETAMDLRLYGIAFTDHLDYDYPDYDDVFMIDFDKYSEFIDKLKEDYSKNKNM